MQLVKARTTVWIDKWELNVGDSLIQRVQEAVAGASALLVVLSKASVASEWVKKELSAGLVRELDEKRVVVLPVLLEDCEIPLFLRDKLYADFRTNFDVGLAAVKKAIDRVTNDARSRIVEADGHVDWGIDWGVSEEGLLRMTLTFVEQFSDRPNTILTVVNIVVSEAGTRRFLEYAALGFDWVYRHILIETLVASASEKDLRMVLSGPSPESRRLSVRDPKSEVGFDVLIDARLLGDDTGSDLLVDIGGQLAKALHHFREATRKLTPEESEKIRTTLGVQRA